MPQRKTREDSWLTSAVGQAGQTVFVYMWTAYKKNVNSLPHFSTEEGCGSVKGVRCGGGGTTVSSPSLSTPCPICLSSTCHDGVRVEPPVLWRTETGNDISRARPSLTASLQQWMKTTPRWRHVEIEAAKQKCSGNLPECRGQ